MSRSARFCLVLTLVTGLCCLVQGCGGYLREYSPSPGVEKPTSGVWIFRHKVKLAMPGRDIDQSFDGMMRLDLAARTIHAVGLAGMGMQLFEVAVTERDMEVRYLHPALRKVPRAADHIAFCLRRIWFDCPAIMPQTTSAGSCAGPGADRAWRIEASGNAIDSFWPDIVHFSNTRDRYTLTIRLLQAQREDTP